MKLNPIFSETLEQLVATAKGNSSQWVKFAKQNPITQKLKARYPQYLKRGNDFLEHQIKEFQKFLPKQAKAKTSSKKKDE